MGAIPPQPAPQVNTTPTGFRRSVTRGELVSAMEAVDCDRALALSTCRHPGHGYTVFRDLQTGQRKLGLRSCRDPFCAGCSGRYAQQTATRYQTWARTRTRNGLPVAIARLELTGDLGVLFERAAVLNRKVREALTKAGVSADAFVGWASSFAHTPAEGKPERSHLEITVVCGGEAALVTQTVSTVIAGQPGIRLTRMGPRTPDQIGALIMRALAGTPRWARDPEWLDRLLPVLKHKRRHYPNREMGRQVAPHRAPRRYMLVGNLFCLRDLARLPQASQRVVMPGIIDRLAEAEQPPGDTITPRLAVWLMADDENGHARALTKAEAVLLWRRYTFRRLPLPDMLERRRQTG